MHSNWKIYKLLLVSLLLFGVVACKKMDPNPELRDPIYSDLVKGLKETTTELAGAEKSLEQTKKELKDSLVNSVERTVARRALKKANKAIKRLRQKQKYFDIRSKRRLAEDRYSYRVAFKNGESWPDPLEYKAYLANKKLRSANMNWNARVPKLFEGNPNYIPGRQKSAEKSE